MIPQNNKNPLLGLQLFSVRDELQKDYFGTLEKLAALGYRNLEIAVHNIDACIEPNAAVLRRRLDELGMKVVSSHLSPLDRHEEIAAYLGELGCPAVGCSIAFFRNKQDVLDFSGKLNRYGEMFKKRNLEFYYHNHYQEFQKMDGQYVMDILLAHTDPDLVKVEFDTYWAQRGGVDPVEYLKKLGDRCDLVHQKDLPAGIHPVNLFETIGEEAEIAFESFVQMLEPEQFTEIGEGVMDIPAIVRTIREIGAVKYVFVEQDLTLKNQLESVAISYRNMNRLLGD